jgi:DNA repair exonuclease SbcCD ATPase subunit
MGISGVERSKKILDKCIADIEKREAMNAKLQAKIDKVLPDAVEQGIWDPDSNKYVGDFWSYDEKTRKMLWDLEDWIDHLEESKKKMKELQDKLKRAETQYQKDLLVQQKADDIPPILKELQNAVSDDVFEYYKKFRQRILDALEEDRLEYQKHKDANDYEWIRNSWKREDTAYNKLVKAHGYSTISKVRFWTDEEIRQESNKSAQNYVLDLLERVTKYVGEITDYSNLYLNGIAINGIIEGTKGRVSLETILAGGWNIQRLHNRTIIHKL